MLFPNQKFPHVLTSLYIHIPYCISKCKYCDFFSRACGSCNSEGKAIISDDYILSLINEIHFRLKNYKASSIGTIYVGGGTPSLMTQAQIKLLFNSIKEICPFSDDVEITFEVNPDDVSDELLGALEAAGVNRISCGIQSMEQKVLQYAGRRASAKVNEAALKLLREQWHKKLSLDLISALPFETMKSFEKSLDYVIAAKPDHISMYSLTIEEKTPFGKALSSGSLDYDFEKADSMWLYGRDYLESHGYPQYEVSNFAKKENRCRHNLVYWNHKDYLGAGSGATGTIYFDDASGYRWTNTIDVEKYIQFWKFFDEKQIESQPPQDVEEINSETSEFEFFMMSLRKTDGFLESDYKKIFNKELPKNFLQLFDKWQNKGLAEKGNSARFYLNKKGLLFLNSFLEELI